MLLVATSADARTLSSNNLYTSSSLTTFSVDVPNQLWSISFSKPCQNDNANCKLLHLLEWLMKWLSLATLTETVFNEWHFNCSFLTDWNNLYQIKNGLAKFLWKCIFEKKSQWNIVVCKLESLVLHWLKLFFRNLFKVVFCLVVISELKEPWVKKFSGSTLFTV